VLRYSFEELNLHRVSVSVAGDNERAIRFFERAGFVVEAQRRQALHRDGRRWDLLIMGLLKEEWQGRMK
jgi:RimJ/RimL family protein N-acetyltransferase